MKIIAKGAKSPLTIEMQPSDFGPLYDDMRRIGYWLADGLPADYIAYLAEDLRLRAEMKRHEEHAT